MSYTDKEMIRSAQIAYLNISQSVIEEAEKNFRKSNQNVLDSNAKLNYTLSELFEYSDSFKRSIYEAICKESGLDYEVAKNLSREEILSRITDIKSRQIVSEKFDIIDDIVNGEIGSWKVVSYVDNNTIASKGTAGKLVNGEWDHQKFSNSGDGISAVVFETGDGHNCNKIRVKTMQQEASILRLIYRRFFVYCSKACK